MPRWVTGTRVSPGLAQSQTSLPTPHLALGEDVDPASSVQLVQQKPHGWLVHPPASNYGNNFAQFPKHLQRFVDKDDLAGTRPPPHTFGVHQLGGGQNRSPEARIVKTRMMIDHGQDWSIASEHLVNILLPMDQGGVDGLEEELGPEPHHQHGEGGGRRPQPGRDGHGRVGGVRTHGDGRA